MAKVAVLNCNKEKVGDVELLDEVYAKPVRKDILQTVVKWQLACRRAGTHSTKTKGLVSGGGKKPFRQKGTGNARQGSTRSPLNPGGGIIFGPTPRDYSYNLPRKVRQAGLKTALSYLLANDKLFVVDSMDASGKTKELASKLSTFGLNKAVIVGSKKDEMMGRAARNLKSFRFLQSEGINVYDLLKYDAAIISQETLSEINAKCGVN